MSGTISLCLIAGNVEEYIERCLTSFSPIADEICVVRAIGTQKADATLDIASDKFGAIVAEYKNGGLVHPKDGPSGNWPHIDNFAAARQQSFDLASGDYIFWCDTDDVLLEGAEFVRAHAERNGYPAFMFRYDVFGRGIDLTRERMILRGAGKWKHAVHECFDFNIPPMCIEDQRVIVRHLPTTHKTGSLDRNMRIMESIPESELCAGLIYHMHGELMGYPERQTEAVAWGKRAFEHPEMGKAERYEICLNLGRISKKPQVASAFYHQAYAVDPCRREALGLLCSSALDYGRNEEAYAYARQMLATTPPLVKNWNDRPAAYEWLGIDIYTQALRMNNEQDEAERCRLRVLSDSGGPVISLIHATRGRPRQACIARKAWLDLAERPQRIEHIFVIDKDDEASYPLQRMYNAVVGHKDAGPVAAWNLGAAMTCGEIMVQLSDDWTPVPRWDALIEERLGNLSEPKVLAISDGTRKDDLLCMAICTRAYYALDWFLFHPRFFSMYSDNWFTHEAYRRRAVVQARDLVFSHRHPFFTETAEFDAIYERSNAKEHFQQGKETFDLLATGRDWSSVHGWFNYWPFYQVVAANFKEGDIAAEVGTWLGRSLIYLAQECQRLGKRVKLVAVDNYTGEQGQKEQLDVVAEHGGSILSAFLGNIQRCGVAEMIEVLGGDSVAMAERVEDASLAFCFIDAAHDYESVRKDIAAWLPKVKKGGMLAGHDAQHMPVMHAVKEKFPNAQVLGPVWIAV